ncbi:MAG TPA: hypothetical protein VK963_01115, partial [Candidatus Saccharimonadales bacterium]|nr:hypothetical protein [Candidatus Saccharimonadales bacterium]
GQGAMGSPVSGVHSWGPGCIQDFAGGSWGRSALMAPGCGNAVYVMAGPEWTYYEGTYRGSASAIYGYPANDVHRWGSGWVQDLSGGQRGWNILMRGDWVGRIYNLRGAIWQKYREMGGTAGYLGFPTSEEYGWSGIVRQDFEGGSLVWDSAGGARPLAASREQRAVAWARSQVGQTHQPNGTAWEGWCDRFVANAYGRATSGYNTAYDHYRNLRDRGLIHGGDPNVPYGALAFFGPTSGYPQGHVMMAAGDGRFITTALNRNSSVNEPVHEAGLGEVGNYLGWAWANPEWPGR